MSSWTSGTLVHRTEWAPGLVTFTIDAGSIEFEPGQFVNLALDVDGERCKRSYSIASAPGTPLELYVAEVGTGRFTQALFGLPVGAQVEVDTAALGFFTLRWLPADAKDLWLFASGTGLGPFISMLREGQLFRRFERVVVAHSVREAAALGYAAELEQLARERPFTYLPVVTRAEPGQYLLTERFPRLLDDRALESAAGFELTPERAHVMLCGNPQMIQHTAEALERRGLKKHRRREPGHVTIEKYW